MTDFTKTTRLSLPPPRPHDQNYSLSFRLYSVIKAMCHAHDHALTPGHVGVQEEEDENVEENEEYQEGKLRFAGGRKEEATYDAGDEEDKQIAAAVRKEAEGRGGEGEVSYSSSIEICMFDAKDLSETAVKLLCMTYHCCLCCCVHCSMPDDVFGYSCFIALEAAWTVQSVTWATPAGHEEEERL